ncbi:MAG: methyltransferase domain-containing protein, partial [Thermoleophilia bacterium]|nr:methyltransferase domain-containing protein [Thermoleophilia bacterium]
MAGRSAQRARRPGQHFLRSRALIRSLVDGAGIAAGDLVVDVGAGRGAITAELVDRGASVWAVEADPALAALLRERFGGRARVLEADATRLRWPRAPFVVVANLPFAGCGEILSSLLDDPGVPLRRAEVVLQWEAAAKRAALWPSTARAVVWGAVYELTLVRRIARAAFAPPPSVDAGVLRAIRRAAPLVADVAAYRTFVRRCFESRAPLRRRLPPRTVKRLAGELGFAPDAHARDLDARQWAAVFAAVSRGADVPVEPRLAGRVGGYTRAPAIVGEGEQFTTV